MGTQSVSMFKKGHSVVIVPLPLRAIKEGFALLKLTTNKGV